MIASVLDWLGFGSTICELPRWQLREVGAR
jgi:hypothetical protein